jgi:hypothetical protein
MSVMARASSSEPQTARPYEAASVPAGGPGAAVSADSVAGSAPVISATGPSLACRAWATTAMA